MSRSRPDVRSTVVGIEIVSHWPPPDGDHHVKLKTRVEALLPQVRRPGGEILEPEVWSSCRLSPACGCSLAHCSNWATCEVIASCWQGGDHVKRCRLEVVTVLPWQDDEEDPSRNTFQPAGFPLYAWTTPEQNRKVRSPVRIRLDSGGGFHLLEMLAESFISTIEVGRLDEPAAGSQWSHR